MAREIKNTGGIRWKLWLAAGALAVAIVSSAMAGMKVRAYGMNDPAFQLSRERKNAVDIQGLQYASRTKVLRVFGADFERSIFAIPLDERRRRLLAVDWVEDASVSRVWPDRLIVRLRERKPVAFVFFRSGVLLIDAHGVLLDPPPQAQFTFPVLSGVRESEKEGDRADRVRALLHLQEDMGYLAKDISEVNVGDLDSIRIVAKVENRMVELTMGDNNFAQRYQNFLNHYQEIRKHSPNVKSFDLRLDDRITAKE